MLTFVALAIATLEGSAGESPAITGVVSHQVNAWFVTDEVSKLTYEVRGRSFAKFAGKRVTLHGSLAPAAEGQTAIVQVEQIKLATPAGVNAAAGAVGVKSGFVGAPMYAAAGAAAAAATVGGMYASGTFGSDQAASRP